MAKPVRRSSWQAKLLLLLVVFAMAPLVATTYWTLRTQRQVFHASTLASLQALAEAKSEAIDQFTDYRRRDVERIASLLAPTLTRLKRAQDAAALDATPPPGTPQLADVESIDESPTGEIKGPTKPQPLPLEPAPVDDTGGAPPPTQGEPKGDKPPSDQPKPPTAPDLGAPAGSKPGNDVRSRSLLEDARVDLRQTLGLISWDQEEFEELIVIDRTGLVITSTFEGHEGHSAKDLEYFRQGLRATFLQPVFLSPITNQLTMVIATPIRNEELKVVGVLAARLNLRRFFRLLNDTTGLGETGETAVAKKVEDHVVFMAPTRHDSQAALSRTIELNHERARPLQEAARGQSGSGAAIDYRGVPVFAAWRHVPSLEWGLVAKIDQSEAMRAMEESANATLMMAGAIIVLAIGASIMVSRAFVRPLRELQQATERISRGDLDVSMDIRSNDEIGELADSFDRMVAAIKFFRATARAEEEEAIEEDPDASHNDPKSE